MKVAIVKNRYCGARILVADDQESVIDLIVRSVTGAFGCHVSTVETGDEVLEALEEETYDILLTDMRMPGVYGLELIAKAAKARPGMHIVAMTGYPTDFPYIEVIENGAKDFLNKPFLPTELIAKLMRVLDERILRRDLDLAHMKYRSLFDLSMDGTLLLTMDGLCVEDANEAICTTLGVAKNEVIGQSFLELLSGDDQERFHLWIDMCARSGKGTIGDIRVLRPSGLPLHVDATITMVDANGELFAFLSFRDITEKREVDRRLAEAAQRDELTGLFNKRSFGTRMEWAVNSARDTESKLALLTIDLDNFKQCNDTHGHQVGDRLLAAVGDVIQASIRTTGYDEGFRCGGDEFSVLLHNFIEGGPMVVAERMRDRFASIECYGTSMSIGISEFTPDMTVSEFIRAADDALYTAKGQGKNTVCVANSTTKKS